MDRLSDNLYCFRDTCHVYVIRSGKKAVLVDFGSGDVLRHLPSLGVETVTDVLLTHHHRDQAQGLEMASRQGIHIWVPHTEQDLFQDVDAHWQARELYNNYNVRQDRFSLLRSVRISGTLKDYSTHCFADIEFKVLPTPSHTTGSITLIAQLDGRKIAFTGDLIYAPGKVWSMSATEWSYNGCQGVVYGILSLLSLRDKKPDRLLPSHGEPMDDVKGSIDLLVGRFKRLLKVRNQFPHLLELREQPYKVITPHLLQNRTSFACSYVILSESGKALLIDYGYDCSFGLAIGSDRASRRPWLYTLHALKRDFGVHSIDVAIPTHYHDDHVAGFNLLREVEGTQIWAPDNVADLLENPSRYDMPCLWYDPIPVDRKLPLGTAIQWEEYKFTLYEQPGHTLYAAAIAFEVDGQKVLATGDQQGDDGYFWTYNYKNRFRAGDYRRSAELYAALAPDWMISGHWGAYQAAPDYLLKLKKNGSELEQVHDELLPLDDWNAEAEGVIGWIRPYQLKAAGGQSIELDVEVLNPLPQEEEITVGLVFPEGWDLGKREEHVRIPSGQTETIRIQVSIPTGVVGRRFRIAAELSVRSRRFGQQAEALITVV